MLHLVRNASQKDIVESPTEAKAEGTPKIV